VRVILYMAEMLTEYLAVMTPQWQRIEAQRAAIRAMLVEGVSPDQIDAAIDQLLSLTRVCMAAQAVLDAKPDSIAALTRREVDRVYREFHRD
jgi:hypothetical protein